MPLLSGPDPARCRAAFSRHLCFLFLPVELTVTVTVAIAVAGSPFAVQVTE